jgi:hypothetical protein
MWFLRIMQSHLNFVIIKSVTLHVGMNSILLYLGHEMCSGMIPWSWKPFTGQLFSRKKFF